MTFISKKFFSFFHNYPRDSYVFIFASLINSTGSALMWPLTTIYVHNILHRSYGEAGLVLFFQSLAGVLGQVIGGSLYHKIGAKNLIVGSLLLSGIAQLGLIFAKSWYPYIEVMTINGFLNAVTMPAISAFIGFQWREQQFKLFNIIYVSNNVGVAIGTTLAGILASISFNLTFLINGLTTILFSAFFYMYVRRFDLKVVNDEPVGLSPHSDELSTWGLLRNYRAYLFVSLGSLFIWFSTSAWNSGIAPYLNQKGMSLASYSFLWTVNGLVILLAQPLTTLFNRFIAKSLGARLMSSALFYAIAFLFMWLFHSSYPNLIVGMAIATIGEMLISPTVPALIVQTTGNSSPFYLGIVGGFGSAGRLIGPILFGNMFDFWGVSPILAVTTVATFAATFLFAIQRRYTKQHVSNHTMSETHGTHA
ncbi:MAG: MFS transporter [Acidibacillus sp.]|nr:MFS transporter [Acidibacillus sp.]